MNHYEIAVTVDVALFTIGLVLLYKSMKDGQKDQVESREPASPPNPCLEIRGMTKIAHENE